MRRFMSSTRLSALRTRDRRAVRGTLSLWTPPRPSRESGRTALGQASVSLLLPLSRHQAPGEIQRGHSALGPGALRRPGQ